MRRFICLLFCVVILAVPLSGCGSTTLMYTTQVFGKTFSVKIFRSGDDSILTQIDEVCKRDELIYSAADPDSELYALNLTDGAETAVSEDLIRMIRLAVYYDELSGGMYDLTASSLDKLWDFSKTAVPDKKAIQEALSRVGMANVVTLGSDTVTLDNGAIIDFGGLAEAKLTSDVSELLSGLGVRAEIAIGDIICVINEEEGRKVGLKMPYDDAPDSLGSITLTGSRSVVTLRADDGFLLDGVRYHKFLDPTTGMPAATDLLTVTVIAPTATQAYAMAQTIIRTGLYSGLELTGKIVGGDTLMVTDQLEIRVSPGFTETFKPDFTLAYTEQVR
ncbi:MAG TPA: FAD:protein FMN transferase [Oscillospiraceae bacterium]|nr:FAD:protein FMN transferase [Oscillospiraceae bacterium]